MNPIKMIRDFINWLREDHPVPYSIEWIRKQSEYYWDEEERVEVTPDGLDYNVYPSKKDEGL